MACDSALDCRSNLGGGDTYHVEYVGGMMKLILKLFSGAWGYVAIIGAGLAAILTFGASQRKAEREENVIKRLEAENETRKRMDAVKPAKSIDDARSNISGFLRRNDK
ncbi:MAG: hypothetical protein L3J33_03390 [Rhodobacteraceae bacterium]|nr:hypothetical protein [Paracoccaceae bacterium]